MSLRFLGSCCSSVYKLPNALISHPAIKQCGRDVNEPTVNIPTSAAELP